VTAPVRENGGLVVVAAMRDGEWRSHVLGSIGGRCRLSFVDGIHDLANAAATLNPDIALWHAEELLEAEQACAMAIRHVRRLSPRTMVVAYGEMSRTIARSLLSAGRMGVDRLLFRGFDDLAGAIQELGTTVGPTDAELLEIVTTLGVSSAPAAGVCIHCLRRASRGPLTVQRLAEELSVDRKTLRNWLRRAGLPGPERLIGWCRVIAAARLLERSERPVAEVAQTLRFSSVSDLRRMLGRYTGYRPTDVRLHGTSGVVGALITRR
jgi:AraC-like DNA-binding protein